MTTSDRGDWLSVKQLAGVLGITPTGFRSSYLPLIAADFVRPGSGRNDPATYYAPEVIRVHAQRAIDRAVKQSSTDPLLAGGDSPGLERYRQAKAALAELELAERKGALLKASEVVDSLQRLASIIRRARERLQRQFGPAADGIVGEALEDFHRWLLAEYGEATDGD